MSVVYSTIKCFVFVLNLMCLILGTGVVSVCSLGLQYARPSTDEHTYFIIGIILATLVCMTTIFGCYGVVCEQLGVNLVYAFFLMTLLAVQYLQMANFQQQDFYRNSLMHLEAAWRSVTTQPQLMQYFEINYQCCGFNNSRDYNYLGLNTPTSCYNQRDVAVATNLYQCGCLESLQKTYNFATRRNKLFNWTLIATEAVALLYSIILSGIMCRYRYTRRRLLRPVEGYVEPQRNHIGSHAHLISG